MENVDALDTTRLNLPERLNCARMSKSEQQIAIAALQGGEYACELMARAAGWFGALGGVLLDPDWHRLD